MGRWDQAIYGPLYAGAVALRNMVWRIRRPVATGVRTIIIQDGQVLLIRHRAGKYPWGLPGGGIKSKERLAEAARREAFEETGVDVQIEYLLGLYDHYHDGLTNFIAVFVARPSGKTVEQIADPFEIAEARYFALNNLPLGLDKGSRCRVADYQTGERGLYAPWYIEGSQ